MHTMCSCQNGVVSLIDCTLMEDPEGTDDECEFLSVLFILYVATCAMWWCIMYDDISVLLFINIIL